MDRAALLEVVAKDNVYRRGSASRRMSEKSDRIREMELHLELKRMELEISGLTQKVGRKRLRAGRTSSVTQHDRQFIIPS